MMWESPLTGGRYSRKKAREWRWGNHTKLFYIPDVPQKIRAFLLCWCMYVYLLLCGGVSLTTLIVQQKFSVFIFLRSSFTLYFYYILPDYIRMYSAWYRCIFINCSTSSTYGVLLRSTRFFFFEKLMVFWLLLYGLTSSGNVWFNFDT